MSKSHAYEFILGLPEEQIAERFPHGVTLLPDKRWAPAESDLHGMGHRTLGDLIADKRRRILPSRMLHKDSSRGYTSDPHLALRKEPEAIDPETQRRYSEEARAKEDNRRAVMRSRLAQLRQLGIEAIKQGKDPTPILDKALQDFEEAA